MPIIIQSRVGSKGLSEEFSLRKKETAVEPSGWSTKEEQKALVLLDLTRLSVSYTTTILYA